MNKSHLTPNRCWTIHRWSRFFSIGLVALCYFTYACFANSKADGSAIIVPDIFSTGMVLQQKAPIRLWVEGPEDAMVRFELDGQSKVASYVDSRWSVEFPPRETSTKPISLKIFAGATLVRYIEDILVGEVWLASGQSNMHMRLDMTLQGAQCLKLPADPLLRAFNVDLRLMHKNGPLNTAWASSSNTTIGSWSAVGYYFSSRLRQSLKGPVAIIHCSVGASFTETWCSPKLLSRGYPEWESWWEKNQNDPKLMLQNKPSLCYERLLKTVMPYNVRGVIWYQGEGNSGRWAEQPRLFADMVSEWRTAWHNPELPFYFVQLARYQPAQWHHFRNAQRLCWEQIPNTYMAVAVDLSKEFEIPSAIVDPQKKFHPIHPATKKPIGDRLAFAAEVLVYGQQLDHEYSGPRIKQALRKPEGLELRFDFVGKGLKTTDGQELRGFYVAGPLEKYVKAHAKISGQQILLSGFDIDEPTYVRYGAEMDMGKDFEVNLVNMDGLPASPFTVKVVSEVGTKN